MNVQSDDVRNIWIEGPFALIVGHIYEIKVVC